jgi:hypothetical protein
VVKGVKTSVNEFHVCLMFTNATDSSLALQKGCATCGILRSMKPTQIETKLHYCPAVAYALLCCASVCAVLICP